MKYAHILMAFASELWAMQPEKLAAITEFLTTQADGVKFSAEEIEAKIAPQTAKAVARKEGDVAIVPIRGIISNRVEMMGNISGGGGTSVEAFARNLRMAADDEGVKTVILDVDSPGGTVSGVDEAAGLIHSYRGRKPIIAQVNATAASAAYWLASAADEIVVTPSGQVGSIGVYTMHNDISASLEKLGIRKSLISAGPFKIEGNPFGPLSEEALAYVQAQVDAVYEMFIDRVAMGRGVASADVRGGFGQGRMVMAKQAVSGKMADRVGTLEDTLARFGVAQRQPEQAGRRAFAGEREKRALTL
ncbi:MAG: peptidase [Rhizobium sp.]|nr:peptidase [Rhizobium sp.]